MASFEIKWGTKRFTITLNDIKYNEMTVKDLKLKCQELTEVDPQFMKLLSRGAVLKTDTELIKNCNIRSGSKLMLMGSKKHISPLNEPAPKDDATIASRLLWIKNLRESALEPDVKRYEKQVQEHIENKVEQKQTTKELINRGSYLHEQLMRMMEQLDIMPEVNEEERVERRNNVKEIECLLDLIENIKTKLNVL